MTRSLLCCLTGLLIGCNEVSTSETVLPAGEHNVILIVVDTLRRDHLGCYGYERATTPNIDRLARDGIVFDSARSASTYTRESISALITGELPTCAGETGWAARPSTKVSTFGELFKQAGFATSFMTTTVAVRDPAFSRGFDSVLQLGKTWNTSNQSLELTDQAIDFVSRHKHERFALYLHYLDPHAPYRPPPRLRDRIPVAKPTPRVLLYSHVREKLATLQAEGFGPGDLRFDDLIARYDAEISLIDESIGRLIDSLAELGLDHETLVVLTADHGEEFLEHDFVEHAWTLYDEVLMVPLLFWAPGLLKPQRVGEAVSLVDVLPTLRSVLGEADETSGKSLLQRNGDSFVASPQPHPVVSELLVPHRAILRSFVDDDWKYIASQRWLEADERAAAIAIDIRAGEGAPGVWGPVVREELYDLRSDPGERNNRIGDMPEKRAEFAALYDQHRARCAGTFPEANEALSQAQLEALKALGYIE